MIRPHQVQAPRLSGVHPILEQHGLLSSFNGVANLANNQPRLVADLENFLYLIASANTADNGGLWYSANKGFNWTLMGVAIIVSLFQASSN